MDCTELTIEAGSGSCRLDICPFSRSSLHTLYIVSIWIQLHPLGTKKTTLTKNRLLCQDQRISGKIYPSSAYFWWIYIFFFGQITRVACRGRALAGELEEADRPGRGHSGRNSVVEKKIATTATLTAGARAGVRKRDLPAARRDGPGPAGPRPSRSPGRRDFSR